MDNKLTIISLNIEHRKHLDLIMPFLEQRRPDIICLQEIFEDTFEVLKTKLGYEAVFAPRADYIHLDGIEGMAILSRLPIKHSGQDYYEKFQEPDPHLVNIHAKQPQASLLWIKLELADQPINVATTHFTWTPDGEINDRQRINFRRLQKILDDWPDLILTGDFNTPRGKELFDTLSRRYKDNIPLEVTTTVDPNLHSAGKLMLVVDGLFTSSRYDATQVEVRNGLSDHCAILATISVRTVL